MLIDLKTEEIDLIEEMICTLMNEQEDILHDSCDPDEQEHLKAAIQQLSDLEAHIQKSKV